MEMLWTGRRTGRTDDVAQAPLDQWQDKQELILNNDGDKDAMVPPEVQEAQKFLSCAQDYQWPLRQIKVAALTTSTSGKDFAIHAALTAIVQRSGTTAYRMERHVVDFLSQQYDQQVDLGSTICLFGIV